MPTVIAKVQLSMLTVSTSDYFPKGKISTCDWVRNQLEQSILSAQPLLSHRWFFI